MTTYWVRPTAQGAADGSSYANAWGIASAGALTAFNTVSDAEFWLCGEFKAAQASAFTHRIALAGGLSPSKPKIIRGDYAADPCVQWGGYMQTGTWSNISGNIWTSTMLSTSYDDENGCAYAIYFPAGGGHTMLTRTDDSATPIADTFYVSGGDTNIRVNLSVAGDPAGKIMLAQYGYRFQLVRSDTRLRWVHFHGIKFRPVARMMTVDISGTSFIPHGLKFTGCEFRYGSKAFFHLRRASEIEFIDCNFWGVGEDAHIYLKTTTRDDANNTLGADTNRLQINNSHRIDVFNCDFDYAGQHWKSGTADSHGIGIQAADECKVVGNSFRRSRAPIVHWHTSNAAAIQDNILIAHNSLSDLHNGISAATSTLVRGIATESGDAGVFSNRVIRHNWIGGVASMSVTPTYPPMALRCQAVASVANAAECYGNVVVDFPVGIVMPSNAPYTNYHDNTVIDPAGHTISRYALGQSGLYATSICDENTYSGLTDEATMFGNAGVNEASAPSTAVSKTNWINPTGSYRFDVNSMFSVVNALTADNGTTSLTADDGATALIAA